MRMRHYPAGSRLGLGCDAPVRLYPPVLPKLRPSHAPRAPPLSIHRARRAISPVWLPRACTPSDDSSALAIRHWSAHFEDCLLVGNDRERFRASRGKQWRCRRSSSKGPQMQRKLDLTLRGVEQHRQERTRRLCNWIRFESVPERRILDCHDPLRTFLLAARSCGIFRPSSCHCAGLVAAVFSFSDTLSGLPVGPAPFVWIRHLAVVA
jgi:hypothetical protein